MAVPVGAPTMLIFTVEPVQLAVDDRATYFTIFELGVVPLKPVPIPNGKFRVTNPVAGKFIRIGPTI